MTNAKTPLRGVIFDYGNTLIRLGFGRRLTRTDYADVVARSGAERLARFLASKGLLDGGGAAEAFVERYLDVRERNRARADQTGREITAAESLRSTLGTVSAAALTGEIQREAVAESFLPEIEAVEALPGAGEALEFLRRRRVRIALLSNCTDGAYVAVVMRRLGWERYFDPFVTSADLGVRKPLPGAFRPVLDRWAMKPDEIVMIGDSLYHDIAGANRMGIRTIHLTAIESPGDAAHRTSIRPDWVVSSHAELQRLLDPLLG